MWNLIGWIARILVAYLALTFVGDSRRYAAADQGFQWSTGVQTFFCWVIAIALLITRLNKLRIIWLVSLAFFSAQFITLMKTPIVPSVILSDTRLFLSLILPGGEEIGGRKEGSRNGNVDQCSWAPARVG